MCGRYVIDDENDIEEINRIIEEINRKLNSPTVMNTGEIFPTNTVPILTASANKPVLTLMKWGFPKWDGKGVIINAKSETAGEKAMFSKPLAGRRCVIPSTGFYEWQKRNSKSKAKYLFNCPDSRMLYMAGVWSSYKDVDGQSDRFVIITRDANEYISDIHDRMPVILYKDELKRWLADDSFVGAAFNRENVALNRCEVSESYTLL